MGEEIVYFKMRVGIDIRELKRGKETGIGRFILNLIRFINLNDKENEYVLFANQYTRSLNFSGNIKIKIISEFFKVYWDQIVLSRQVALEKLDIFLSPNYIAPVFSSAKLIVTCHDIYFLRLSGNPMINWLRQSYCRFIWGKAALIIAVSEYSRQEVIKFLGCAPDKVRVVYDSVGDKFMPQDKSEAFDKLYNNFPQLKKDFILYVGNLTPHKNIPALIKGFSLLPENFRGRFQLIIVGKIDKNYPKLFELVKGLNLTGKVEFLGSVSEEDLLLLYNCATVLTLVSFWEGFGLPALEAMACGTPVVVSKAASLPEVVGEAGLYVNPHDVEDIARNLEKILSDEPLRRDLSCKGIEQAKKFSIEDSANKILRIFKELYSG